MTSMRWMLSFTCTLAALASACGGNGDTTGSGASGGGGTTGTAGTAGTTASGATAGTGGTTASGATAGTGGTTASGATAGTGGTTTTQTEPPQGSCRTEEDCKEEGGNCWAPGTLPMCGTCFEPDVLCGSDAECKNIGPYHICTVQGCWCSSGCAEGCIQPGDCGLGQSCGADNHCGPAPCASDMDCPDNFTCGGNGCGRKTCTTDADCANYCVLGNCWEAFGTCAVPPP